MCSLLRRHFIFRHTLNFLNSLCFASAYNTCIFLSNSGDSLRHSNNAYFNTKDKDNDSDKRNCAEINKTAGWFNAGCFNTNLNGEYRKDSQNNSTELTWYHW